MLFSVEQAFVGREEIRAPLKTPAWEAKGNWAFPQTESLFTGYSRRQSCASVIELKEYEIREKHVLENREGEAGYCEDLLYRKT